MKILKKANGDHIVKLTVDDWFRIGKKAGWANEITTPDGFHLQWQDFGDAVAVQAEYKGQTMLRRMPKQEFMQRFGKQIQQSKAAQPAMAGAQSQDTGQQLGPVQQIAQIGTFKLKKTASGKASLSLTKNQWLKMASMFDWEKKASLSMREYHMRKAMEAIHRIQELANQPSEFRRTGIIPEWLSEERGRITREPNSISSFVIGGIEANARAAAESLEALQSEIDKSNIPEGEPLSDMPHSV